MSLRVVVMGVSGCGKSTLGKRLARALRIPFVEGDALHPPANVQRMAAGIALTDADRQGWLEALADRLRDARQADRGLVIACSALRRRYRDILRDGAADVRFVHLHGDPAVLARRLARRRGHYMPASLLPSQLETLEPPGPDEDAIAFDIRTPPGQITAEALRHLQTPTP
ncbi:gluconokinase [Ideonella sp. A 288]|uniref:gluconokinase n=1 Tax=Ideonella sp. A 288 TaxID=1962181 RepID=UPI001F249807|nr:gluconokinase [Ideonella sp. A 288]